MWIVWLVWFVNFVFSINNLIMKIFVFLVVILVYNEEDGLVVLFVCLYFVFDVFGILYEVVFVNDGSCDCFVVMLVE